MIIKAVRFYNKMQLNFENKDKNKKACRFIILTGNNSTGKTFFLNTLYQDFSKEFLTGWEYIFDDKSSIGWGHPRSQHFICICSYLQSISQEIQENIIGLSLLKWKVLTSEIKKFFNLDKVNRDRLIVERKECRSDNSNKNKMSEILNMSFGSDIYELDEYHKDVNNENNEIRLLKSLNLPIKNASAGELWLLRFIVSLIKNIKSNEKTKQLILIDEPETFLHPMAQINFANLFEKFEQLKSCEYQCFISTHSPFIIKSFLENFKNDVKIIRFTRDIDINKNVTYKRECIDKPIKLNSKNISFSEIIYNIFQIPTNDYFLELYDHLMNKWYIDNKIQNLNFYNFDNYYLRKFEKSNQLKLIQYKQSSNTDNGGGVQTNLTRLRHLIAHGGANGNEQGYQYYFDCKEKGNTLSKTTIDFYEKYENKYTELLNDSIKQLINIIDMNVK